MQPISAKVFELFKEAFFLQSLNYLLVGLLALWLPAVLWLQTSRYGWKLASDARKFISELSAIARQPEIPHLNATNRKRPRLAQVVPVRLERSSVTDWNLTSGLCDRHRLWQLLDCQWPCHPLSGCPLFSDQEERKLNWWQTGLRRLTLTLYVSLRGHDLSPSIQTASFRQF